MPFDATDLAARYARRRIATAANARDDVVGVLLGDSEPAGWVDDDRAELDELRTAVDTAIADAADQCAAELADQYDWDDVEDHPALRRVLADLVMYHLHQDVIPEDVLNRHRNAVRRLERLAKGDRLLTDAASGDPLARRDAAQSNAGDPDAGATFRDGSTPLLRREDLGGF